MNEAGALFKKTRRAMEMALAYAYTEEEWKARGGKLTYRDFAAIIGYESGAHATIARIEKGERVPAGPIILRVAELLAAATLVEQDLIVVPEWAHVISVDPDDDDGSSVVIERRWWPRLSAMATVQAGALLGSMGWCPVGQLRNPSGEEPMEVWIQFLDKLPEDMYVPFIERAYTLLAQQLAYDAGGEDED